MLLCYDIFWSGNKKNVKTSVCNFPEYLYFFSVAWIISLQFIVSTFNLSKSNE